MRLEENKLQLVPRSSANTQPVTTGDRSQHLDLNHPVYTLLATFRSQSLTKRQGPWFGLDWLFAHSYWLLQAGPEEVWRRHTSLTAEKPVHLNDWSNDRLVVCVHLRLSGNGLCWNFTKRTPEVGDMLDTFPNSSPEDPGTVTQRLHKTLYALSLTPCGHSCPCNHVYCVPLATKILLTGYKCPQRNKNKTLNMRRFKCCYETTSNIEVDVKQIGRNLSCPVLVEDILNSWKVRILWKWLKCHHWRGTQKSIHNLHEYLFMHWWFLVDPRELSLPWIFRQGKPAALWLHPNQTIARSEQRVGTPPHPT